MVLEFQYVSELNYPNLAIERSMMAIIAWSNDFLSQPLIIKSTSFTYPQPKHSAEYRVLFGEHTQFNASVNKIVLSSGQFYQVLDTANPYVREVLKERSEQVKRSIESVHSTVSKVQTLLNKDLALFCNISEAVRALHMSRATLYRKLKDEGETFSDLVKSARNQKVLELKASNFSGEASAEALGFSDVSSYYRFIK